MHVGNGALIDNTYKLCSHYISNDIEILSIDPETNSERFPKVKEDIFSEYGGKKTQKALFTARLVAFYLLEALNIKIFSGKLHLPWRGNLKTLRDSLTDNEICISMSGETINDHYRPHLYLRLLTYHLVILRKKKFLIFPQSIGPVFRPLTKFLLRKMLGNSYAIISRDNASFELSKYLWNDLPVRLVFCPDVAITQESYPEPLPLSDKNKKVIGLTVSDIPREEMGFKEDYLIPLITEITKAFPADEFQFLLMPSNYKKNKESKDYLKCKEAKRLLEDQNYSVSILENTVIHPDTYQGLQRNLFAFISTRMHVGILGTSAGTPTLMINTQHKILEYMKLVHMEEYVVELTEIHYVAEKLKLLKEKNNEIRKSLTERNITLQNQIKSTISVLGQEIILS